ncbi:MAG: 3-dehydroquinate synthase [Saccharofermentanales bacterium]
MPEILATTSNGNYEITIANSSLSLIGRKAKPLVRGNKAFIVTDKNVARYYLGKAAESLLLAGFQVESFVVEPGEQSKDAKSLFTLYEKFHDFGITRSDLIVALGGGVVGDLAGFAAATYMRGIPLIQVPTTLLAQVDSSVGGKTAIDLPFGKNLAGSFYHPLAVIMDPGVLATLPRSIMNEGMAEVIKYGCIRDVDLFEKIYSNRMDLEWVLERCVHIKTSVVAKDERDTGERMLLNFGHTIGHAIEKVALFSDFSHGQAISIGMSLACAIGEHLGVTKSGTTEKVKNCLEKFGLPTKCELPLDEILFAIKSDKKNLSDKIYFVLLKEIGTGVLYPMDSNTLSETLREVAKSV